MERPQVAGGRGRWRSHLGSALRRVELQYNTAWTTFAAQADWLFATYRPGSPPSRYKEVSCEEPVLVIRRGSRRKSMPAATPLFEEAFRLEREWYEAPLGAGRDAHLTDRSRETA